MVGSGGCFLCPLEKGCRLLSPESLPLVLVHIDVQISLLKTDRNLAMKGKCLQVRVFGELKIEALFIFQSFGYEIELF